MGNITPEDNAIPVPQIFQVGVVIHKVLVSDVIVRVEANSREEAEDQALDIMAEICERSMGDDDLEIDADAWNFNKFATTGRLSDTDYSDMSDTAEGYPVADVDWTEQEEDDDDGEEDADSGVAG